jgi:hypothetical protein
VRIFLNRKRGVPIDDRRHVYRVRLPFMNPRYPNDAAVEFALGGKVAVWQSRRPEIMVYAALVIFGIDSCSGRLTRILKTLRLGTFNHSAYRKTGLTLVALTRRMSAVRSRQRAPRINSLCERYRAEIGLV